MKSWQKIALIFTIIAIVAPISQNVVFPTKFAWGVATSAYQVEGAWNISGKGPSIWDNYTHYTNFNLIYDNETGDVADDVYDRYLGDIAIMKQLGIKASRISISWSRVLPNGTTDSPNAEGVAYYNNVINALLANGIQPYVTLYHWDLPNALNNRTNVSTWLDPNIINLFNDYADFCFQNFGDRVKQWITINEIQSFAWGGYGPGTAAPGRCSPNVEAWCETIGGGGNSATEPYIAAHHALLAHATAVKTYRQKYQKTQNGQIGITINAGYGVPYNASNIEDVAAVDTYIEFQYGWFADPIVFGKYPDVMVNYITGGRLPNFTQAESELMKGSYDFLGLNYYTSRFTQWTGVPGQNYSTDSRVNGELYNVNGEIIGPPTGNSWEYIYPQGLRSLLSWVDQRYYHPPQYIFENGVSCPNESQLVPPQVLNDTFRINYLRQHIAALVESVLIDGVDLRGYFIWSIIDNFEWNSAFSIKFGLVWVDFQNNLTRYIKDSAYFYAGVIASLGNSIDVIGEGIHNLLDVNIAKVKEMLGHPPPIIEQ